MPNYRVHSKRKKKTRCLQWSVLESWDPANYRQYATMCQIGYNVFAFCSILAAANHRVHTEAISAQSATLLIPASSLPHEQKEQDCWETSHWKDHNHSATCASRLTDARCRQGMALLSPPLYGDYGCHTTCTISKDRLQWDNVLMACQVCISQHEIQR